MSEHEKKMRKAQDKTRMGGLLQTHRATVERAREEGRRAGLETGRQVVLDLLLSADVTWEQRGEGHDWREAVQAARDWMDDVSTQPAPKVEAVSSSSPATNALLHAGVPLEAALPPAVTLRAHVDRCKEQRAVCTEPDAVAQALETVRGALLAHSAECGDRNGPRLVDPCDCGAGEGINALSALERALADLRLTVRAHEASLEEMRGLLSGRDAMLAGARSAMEEQRARAERAELARQEAETAVERLSEEVKTSQEKGRRQGLVAAKEVVQKLLTQEVWPSVADVLNAIHNQVNRTTLRAHVDRCREQRAVCTDPSTLEGSHKLGTNQNDVAQALETVRGALLAHSAECGERNGPRLVDPCDCGAGEGVNALPTLERTLNDLRLTVRAHEASLEEMRGLLSGRDAMLAGARSAMEEQRARAERAEAEIERVKDARDEDRRHLTVRWEKAELARQEAEADNAALLDGFLRVMNLLENIGRPDDAASVRQLTKRAHPGSALLERLRLAEADNAALLLKIERAGNALARGGFVDLTTDGDHPGDALLERLRTLEQQVAEMGPHLEGYASFSGPCEHGRDPWDRCDDCGEGNAVQAAARRIVQLEQGSVPKARVMEILDVVEHEPKQVEGLSTDEQIALDCGWEGACRAVRESLGLDNEETGQ